MERTTEPDEIDIEILQQSFAVEQITQKFQKHKNETPREKTQKLFETPHCKKNP